MADLSQIEAALVKADAAGDTEGARILAGEVRRLRSQEASTPQAPMKIGAAGFPDALRETLQGTDWGTRNIASAGTGLSNLLEGGKQLIQGSELFNLATKGRLSKPSDEGGLSPQAQSNQIMAQEAPVGAVAGSLAAAAPMMAAGNSPGAAGVMASLYGALNPAENQGQRVTSAGASGVLGAGGQAIANKGTQMLADKLKSLQAAKTQRAPIDATIKEAMDAGYVIPPGQVNPSFLNRQLESAGGKIATQQMASSKNQTVTDALARKAASLTDDAPITPETLRAARDVIKKPYQDIAGLGLQPKLDALDAARSEANAAWREYSRQGTRAAINDYKTFSTQAKQIEKEIEADLFKANQPDLMKQFRDARVALAKNHDVESALIEGGGSVDSRAIAKMFQRGDKMTGELKTIGSFANNFPKVSQPDKVVGTPDAHNMKFLASLLMGGGGGAALGPAGIAAGAIPMAVGPLARAAMFSKPMQNSLLPSYSLGLPSRVGGGLLGYAPVGGAVLGANAFNQ